MSTSESQSGLVMELAEDFLERYRQGQRPSLREYIERYPQLADEIREVFPAMAMMENIALAEESLAGPAAAPVISGSGQLEQLGDFRIIREVGKGGMGIVYEAEQVSLGRYVALKVLPRAMLVESRQKHRFEREAKAAARLHHTNIVPVFGVGDHEGMPYYVMQFIQGLGLDMVLEELKRLQGGALPSTPEPAATDTQAAPPLQVSAAAAARSLITGRFAGPVDLTQDFPEAAAAPAPPSVASSVEGQSPVASAASETLSLSGSSVTLPGLSSTRRRTGKATYWHSVAQVGIQVAGALDYAHQQGILHRDIKPSNLLLDNRGTVWVTDFGLAKADDQQNLTHTGDVLGTLRYMPPEAFDGRADARGDIYSIGLTLYELIALRPAFQERDRHRLIKQVTQQEPERLGRLVAGLPRDLETIIHKAIDREPARRYATAGELAADLQRFLDDEPILARRTSNLERFTRWCRHNPIVAGLSAALLLTLLAVTGFSLVAAARFRDLAALNAQAAINEREAKEREEQLRAQADNNFEKARAAVNEYLTKVSESQLLKVAGMQKLRGELLGSAQKFFERLAAEHANDPGLQAELAATFARIGQVYDDVGSPKEAREAYDRAIQIYEQTLAAASDRSVELREGLASVWQQVGDQEFVPHADRALVAYQRCIALQQALTEAEPQEPRHRKNLARAYNGLGLAFNGMGQRQQAFDAYRKSIEIRLSLLEILPEDPRLLHGCSESLNNLGMLVAQQGHGEEALEIYRRSEIYGLQAFRRAPYIVEFALDRATSLGNSAVLNHNLGHGGEAVEQFQKAVDHCTEYVRANPAVRAMRTMSLHILRLLKPHHLPAELVPAVRRMYRQVRDLFVELPPQSIEDHLDLARAQSYYAWSLGQWQPPQTAAHKAEEQETYLAAIAALRQAVAAGLADSSRLTTDPYLGALLDRPEFKQLLLEMKTTGGVAARPASPSAAPVTPVMIERARASTGLAIALIEMDFGHVNEAMQEFDQAVAGLQARFDAESGNADLAIELAQLYASWGRTLWRIGRCAEALSCFDKAVARLQRDSHPSLTNDQRNAQDQSYAVLEEFFGEIGLWEEAAKLHHQSLAHTSAPTLGGQWATEAEYRLLLADKEGYRRIALAMSAAANDAGGRDSLIQTLTLVPDAPTPPTAKQLMIWADERRQQAETNNLSIRIFQPAWAAYRAGDYGKTLALLDELKEPFDQYWPLQAMALYQLGRKDEARQRLREIDHWVSETLAPVMTRRTDMRLPGGVHYWEDWLRFFLNYREAVALITGSTQADSPWWRLYRGRLQQILGQPKKADVEFQAAIALRPDDPGLLLARGHLFALEGQWERARADFELAAKLPVDQPRPWIEHGRFLAEHGHHEEADKAFAHAAAIAHDATYPFLEVAWWFVSGYRQDPELPFPPEFEADPARAPAAAVGSGDLAWQSVPVRVGSGPDLRQVIGADARGTAYALAYVYASTPRTVSLSISGNRAIVLWANGERIDGITPGKGFLNADRVPLVLRAGRNTLLVRLTLEGNSTYLHARIHDGAWTRMEQRARLGLWPEAAPEAVQALEEAMIANDPFRARCAIQVARLGGKEAHAVEAAKKFIRRGWLNRDRNHVESVAILNGVFPALNLERSELVACADTLAKASSATSSWLALFAGYAYFRANKLEEASRVAAPEFTDPRFWILRAMIAHQKHEPGEAKRFLAKVDDWYGRQTRKFLDSARLGLPGDGFWFAYAEFLALYEEAKETIEGKPLRDANADQIRAHGLAEWQKLRPELLDFDLAVRLQPDQFRTWLARAQRLYELNRPKEAEADLEQAAQRANDDSAFWRARGRLHLRFGQTEAAAQSFARALEGEQFSSGRSQWFTKAIGLEVGSNEALFQAVTRLRPGEPGLWFNRAQYLVGLGRWKEAAAAYERWYLQVQPEDTYFALDRTALLVQAGDQAGYRRACKELLDRLGPQPSFQRTEQTVKACSLAPGGIEDPLALVPLAEDVVKRSQTEVYYPYFQLALGLAHYRAGQDDAAAPILAALADRKWPAEYREAARALLALVQYRKGELASARRSLNEARSQLHSLIIRLDRGQRYTSTLWRDRLIAQIFLREAEAVIEGNGGRVAETENGRD